MDKREFVLAALAPAHGKPHSPVQVQKLLFLLERNAARFLDGPHFDFKPYNYGPFDKDVYRVLDDLEADELAFINNAGRQRTYALTPLGQDAGARLLEELPEAARDYMRRLSDRIFQLDFMQLVSAIYKAYPEMRENSVIRTE